jgi:hypothetical protein
MRCHIPLLMLASSDSTVCDERDTSSFLKEKQHQTWRAAYKKAVVLQKDGEYKAGLQSHAGPALEC